jgi:hypothetical protein
MDSWKVPGVSYRIISPIKGAMGGRGADIVSTTDIFCVLTIIMDPESERDQIGPQEEIAGKKVWRIDKGRREPNLRR